MRHKLTCVFVHGWAMNSAVWQPVVESLPDWIEPRLVDLPGHGRLADRPADTLPAFARELAAVAHGRCLWVGWSLGGLVAMQLALDCPELVAGLLLVSASPKFVRGENWPDAVDAGMFAQFATDLERDTAGTVGRFLALQAVGTRAGTLTAKQTVRRLQQLQHNHRQASPRGLRSGLEILADADLRAPFAALDSPLACVLGECDRLVPAGVAAALQRLNPRVRVETITGAGHAPFISHSDQFTDILVCEANRISLA